MSSIKEDFAVEEWRDIDGYEGLYQVSKLGRVKSLERRVWNGNSYYIKPEKILKNNLMKNGYCRVTLTKDGKQEQYYIHRLVATAFLPNDDGLPEVDHIDANPRNNRIDNLRWVTHLTNMHHCVEMGRNYDGTANLLSRNARIKTSLKLRKPVLRSDGRVFNSVKEAAAYMGLSANYISKVIRKEKECRGFRFTFLTKESEVI